MKQRLMLAVLGLGSGLLAAVPQISNVGMARKQADGAVSIAYQLSGEPAVVTMSFESEGMALGTGARLAVTGDVNVLVQPGTHTAVLPSLPVGVDGSKLAVQVRAWATNCPPDYLVLCLTNVNEKAHYYLSADEVPGGVTAQQYKTSHLVMRKIPAANVEWRMGSPAQEASREQRVGNFASAGENLHYVRMTEDYYLGIYPVTYRQHCWATGSAGSYYGAWGDSAFAAVRRDDWPYMQTQFVSLRSWMHDSNPGKDCHGGCGIVTKCWPEYGHEIDAANSDTCTQSTKGKYTPYLRGWRDRLGFEFDIPTDAQWEFACRAGTVGAVYTSTEVACYTSRISDEQLNEISWNVNNSFDETLRCVVPHTVGLKKPNAFGLYDMIGNVFEWCLDVGSVLASSADTVVDPVGRTGQNNDRSRACVVRGGSYASDTAYCRSAARAVMSTTGLNNPAYAADSAKNDPTANWQVGYRLCLPAQAAR